MKRIVDYITGNIDEVDIVTSWLAGISLLVSVIALHFLGK
jgi:hypothetical protein